MVGDAVDLLDLSFEGDTLVARVERTGAMPDDALLFSWNERHALGEWVSMGAGVCHIRLKSGKKMHVEVSEGSPDPQLGNIYLWADTAHTGNDVRGTRVAQ